MHTDCACVRGVIAQNQTSLTSGINCIRILGYYNYIFFLFSIFLFFLLEYFCNLDQRQVRVLSEIGRKLYAYFPMQTRMCQGYPQTECNRTYNPVENLLAIPNNSIFIIYYLLCVVRQEISGFSLVPSGFCFKLVLILDAFQLARYSVVIHSTISCNVCSAFVKWLFGLSSFRAAFSYGFHRHFRFRNLCSEFPNQFKSVVCF